MSSPRDPLWALLTGVGLSDEVATWPDIEAAIFADSNAARKRERRAACGWHAEAAGVARRHAEDMLRRRYFDHKTPEGLSVGDRLTRAGVRWTRCAENLYGQPSSGRLDDRQMRAFGRAAVTAWLRGRGHRQNLLSSRLARMGVGVAATSGNVVAVQVFVA